jgi:hypothetical protein
MRALQIIVFEKGFKSGTGLAFLYSAFYTGFTGEEDGTT